MRMSKQSIWILTLHSLTIAATSICAGIAYGTQDWVFAGIFTVFTLMSLILMPVLLSVTDFEEDNGYYPK